MAVRKLNLKDVFKFSRLVKKTAAWLISKGKPWLIVELFFQSGFKYLGYFLGKRYQKLPMWMVKSLSMNKAYWQKSSEI